MNIKILHLVEGAKKATGLTIIIDVFRAFSTEAYFFANGADKVIPIGDADVAYELKKENPDMILCGERFGKILPGFDIGNSPTQNSSVDLTGKTVIHTTSAGTQGISNAIHADEILGSSLVTAKATAEYIKRSGAQDISIVCMGWAAIKQAEEDTLCANYIKNMLEGKETNLEAEIEKLKYTAGAHFFDKSQNDVFPENDFYLCTDVNKFNFVLKLNKEDNYDIIERIFI